MGIIPLSGGFSRPEVGTNHQLNFSVARSVPTRGDSTVDVPAVPLNNQELG